MVESNPHAPPLAPPPGVGEWLAAWAQGQVSDPQTAFLDRIFRERIAEHVSKLPRRTNGSAPAAPSPLQLDAELLKLIEAVVNGTAPTTAAAARLQELLEARAPAASTVEPGELEVANERLRAECSRAHAWRFHLESRARAVHARVQRLLQVEQRAPSYEEMEDIVQTLREAVEWAP